MDTCSSYTFSSSKQRIWNEWNILLSFIANNNMWCLIGICLGLFLYVLIDWFNFPAKAFWPSFTRRGLHADTNWMHIISSALILYVCNQFLVRGKLTTIVEETEPFLSQKHGFTNTEIFHLPIWVFSSMSPIFSESFSVIFQKLDPAKWEKDLFGSAFGSLKVFLKPSLPKWAQH